MKKLILLIALSILFPALAAAQGNAFNFQGRLNDGTSPANGLYDLQFKLFDAATGGNQIGQTVSRPRTTLVNGVFSVALDFGAVAFQTPNSTFIEIAVKPNPSPNPYTILGPRQQLTVVPFASRAQNSTNADTAQNAVNAQNAANAANADRLGSLGPDGYLKIIGGAPQKGNFDVSGYGKIRGDLIVGDSIKVGEGFDPRQQQGKISVGNGLSVFGSSPFIALSDTAIQNNEKVSELKSVGGDVILSTDSGAKLTLKDGSGNVTQPISSSGLVKAMVYVNGNGTIIRCYNGVTGTSTGNCGFTINHFSAGQYSVDFGFRVDDRFVSVTPYAGSGVTIAAGFALGGTGSNFVTVVTNITDIDHLQSYADNNFMIVVY